MNTGGEIQDGVLKIVFNNRAEIGYVLPGHTSEELQRHLGSEQPRTINITFEFVNGPQNIDELYAAIARIKAPRKDGR